MAIAAIQIGTNYAWDKNAGELREDLLVGNPLVRFMTYGGRIFLWVFIVIIFQNIIFLTVRYSCLRTYEKGTYFWNDLLKEIKVWKLSNLVHMAKPI